MQQRAEKKGIRLAKLSELDPVKTFECGQCFRWNADENGVYTGVAMGRAARVWVEGDSVYIDADEKDVSEIWHDYFDLDRDYGDIVFDGGEYLDACVRYGAGIRILRQDRWEALCSFIISQCNNIPRIKRIIETLCREFGDPINAFGETLYSFPPAERIASLETADLAPLRCGYRASYIIEAARAVTTGELNLEELAACDYDTAIKELKRLKGVGDKVANCVALFGLYNMSGFPVDVWMKRALKKYFPRDFDPKFLGPYAGLAQQYIFYYTRNGKEGMGNEQL
ncbi:MAG: DNA-3-methyladenine glycosylase family protein [Oscillospiraceae bacterium]|jgi:N-glycosylase/DNA lyase